MFNTIQCFEKNKKLKKNKKYIFFKILLILIGFFFIKTKIISPIITSHTLSLNNELCTHYSEKIVINIYNIVGNLQFQVTANHIKYFTDQKITSFVQPIITVFNEKNIAIWQISCNYATLNYNKVLNLYGYVYINKIINNINVQSIITNQVLINLIDQDIISNNTTIIHGYCFYSVGSKMHSNLKTQITKLFGETYTQYDIKQM